MHARRARVGLHSWQLDASPGLLTWSCEHCTEQLRLTAISAADPERLRSALVVLEARTCAR